MSNRLIRVLSNHIKRDGKQDNVRLIRKVKHSSKRAFFPSAKFPLSHRLLHVLAHIHDLRKKTPDVPTICFVLYRILLRFLLPVFIRLAGAGAGSGWQRDGNRTHNYMHEQSYFTQFYDTKRRTEERTFDIYSLLFIFIISFAHNSYTRTPSIVLGLPRKLSGLRNHRQPSPLTAPKVVAVSSCGMTFGLRKRTKDNIFCALFCEHECNDNKLCWWKSCRELLLHSREILSIYIT